MPKFQPQVMLQVIVFAFLVVLGSAAAVTPFMLYALRLGRSGWRVGGAGRGLTGRGEAGWEEAPCTLAAKRDCVPISTAFVALSWQAQMNGARPCSARLPHAALLQWQHGALFSAMLAPTDALAISALLRKVESLARAVAAEHAVRTGR